MSYKSRVFSSTGDSKERPLVIVQFSAITRQGIRETTRYVVLGLEFSKAVSTPVYQVVPGQWQATIYTAKLLGGVPGTILTITN